MGILIFLLFCGLMFAGFLYVVAGLLGGPIFQKNRPVGASASERLKAVVASKPIDAWQEDSLSLLGLNVLAEQKEGLLGGASSGFVQSIYQENVAAYAAEKAGRETLLAVKTNENELFYRIFHQSGQADIFIDGQPFGSLTGDVLLDASERAARPVARIERGNDDEIGAPIIIGARRVAAFAWHERSKKMYPRALDLYGSPNSEEQKILLALTFLEIIRPNL